jgi:DNA-binding response OmpR family regulator
MPKILIVDDSPDLLNVLSWILEKNGFSCVTTYYRQGLFSQLARFIPSMIFLDVNLSDDDGRNICRKIKENPETKDIPVIMCSGDHSLLENFESYQADACLKKPFDTETILKTIAGIRMK